MVAPSRLAFRSLNIPHRSLSSHKFPRVVDSLVSLSPKACFCQSLINNLTKMSGRPRSPRRGGDSRRDDRYRRDDRRDDRRGDDRYYRRRSPEPYRRYDDRRDRDRKRSRHRSPIRDRRDRDRSRDRPRDSRRDDPRDRKRPRRSDSVESRTRHPPESAATPTHPSSSGKAAEEERKKLERQAKVEAWKKKQEEKKKLPQSPAPTAAATSTAAATPTDAATPTAAASPTDTAVSSPKSTPQEPQKGFAGGKFDPKAIAKKAAAASAKLSALGSDVSIPGKSKTAAATAPVNANKAADSTKKLSISQSKGASQPAPSLHPSLTNTQPTRQLHPTL